MDFSAIVLAFVMVIVSATGETPENIQSAHVILSGEHTVTSPNETLVILGGDVTIAEQTTFTSRIYLAGGDLNLEGEMINDIIMTGGTVKLNSQARLAGDIHLYGGVVETESQARHLGQVRTAAETELWSEAAHRQPTLQSQVISTLIGLIITVPLAWLIAWRWPLVLDRLAGTITSYPLLASAVGLFTLIIGLVLIVFMAFTLILIPVSMFGLVTGALAVVLGWVGWGGVVARKIRQKTEWPQKVTVILGTVIFVILMNIVSILPLVGALITIALGLTGLGAVVLSRGGIYRYQAPD